MNTTEKLGERISKCLENANNYLASGQGYVSIEEMVLLLEESHSCLSITMIVNQIWDWVEKMGWHNKTPLEYLALIASEVGEAVNECRAEKPTEKLGEELADIILRTCDFAKVQGIDLQSEIQRKLQLNTLSGNKGRLK